MIEPARQLDDASDERAQDYETFVRPRVLQMLRAVRMDVVYHRAEGNYVYYYNDAGEEQRVLDLLGGFGATLFGHNHPYLLERAKRALSAGRPFHAQASVRSSAAQLGRRLSELVGRSTGQRYVATFANSGAEAVEAALKHAGFEYSARNEACQRQIRESVIRVRRRLAQGRLTEAQPLLQSGRAAFGSPLASLDELFERVLAQVHSLAEIVPEVWSLRRGFHGKTGGALRLTHNPKFRAPWDYLGSAVFLDPEDPRAPEAAAQNAALPYFHFEQSLDGSFELKESSLSRALACFVEPLQGEGGIWELDPGYVSKLRELARLGGFPLVFDEIQSGLGRTGRFLASEALGVTGDYYVFSKSLGGGLAKISAMLVDSSRYIDEFGYLHTSTFAEDDWSCEVALGALELLEEKDGRVYQLCQERGQYLRQQLERLQAKYPSTVRQVRGRGLMIGLELETRRKWKSRLLRVLLEQDLLGFMLAGYLLRERGVRVAPGLSANTTLRLEPSAFITRAELDEACHALEHMVALLHSEQTREFVRFLAGSPAAHESAPASRPQQRNADADAAFSSMP